MGCAPLEPSRPVSSPERLCLPAAPAAPAAADRSGWPKGSCPKIEEPKGSLALGSGRQVRKLPQ